MTEKYKLQQNDISGMDLTSETLAKLKQILPEVFSEGADGKPHIDVEKLKIVLGGEVDIDADDKTRYSFCWSGKKQAQALANQPSTATLRPSVEDSKNWDNTQNVYIEGDNLEVLKLLQKSYYGQIKMIYIDPPYNTGKDFVYKDNFHDNVKNYLQLTGQVDDEGNKIGTNTDKSGRYHTDWLNMMYPRLKLARNLLKDDGVIFISIDDNEVHNLRKICDEIFGEDNFIGSICRKQSSGAKNDTGKNKIVMSHDSILTYSKQSFTFTPQLIQSNKKYKFKDEIGNFTIRALEMQGGDDTLPLRDKMGYSIYFNQGTHSLELKFDYDLTQSEVYLLPDNNLISNGYKCYRPKKRGQEFGIWRWGADTFIDNFNKQNVYFKDNSVYLKEREQDFIEKYPESICLDYLNMQGTNEVKDIFDGSKYFTFPKPLLLIKHLLSLSSNSNSIILDFFSGSATTAHAVMQLNAEDGGKRKYICVQLPEATAPDSEAYKAGYKNICEIGKERIRRAGEKVFTEWTEKQQKSAQSSANAGLFTDDTENNTAQTSLDIGFKVFKLDSSNIKPFDVNDMFADDLLVANRSALDLFYELVLKQGYSLDNRQCVLNISGTRCYALVHEDNTPFILAVLDDTIKTNFALELLKYALTLVIVKDGCFGTDEIKLNLLATLEQLQSKDNPLQIRII